MRLRFFIATFLLLGLGPTGGCAQSPEAQIEQAEEALRTGDYATARQHFGSLLADEGNDALTLPYFETFLAVGDYEAGLTEVERRLVLQPNAALLHHAKGRLLAAMGRLKEAEAAYRHAARQEEFARNTLALAEVLEVMGHRQEAMTLYAGLFQRYRQGQLRAAPDLTAAGRAAAALEQFRDANEAFRTAHRIEARSTENLYAWAELFRAKYNDADAQRTYEEALAVNPTHAGALIGYARSLGSFARREELAQQALTVNPRHVGALDLLAELRILDGLYDEAEQLVQQALTVNPTSTSSLAHLASIHHLRGNFGSFAETEARALAISPRAGGFYVTLADNLSHRFRYPDALTMTRKAIEAEPDNVAAYAAHGAALLRLGHADEARRYLDATFERDPFNLFVANTLTLLDEYEAFETLESPHFRVLLHTSERDVLGPLILTLAEEAYTSMQPRFGYTPAGKILIEAYNDHGDFGVRIAGVPHLGLLGVSFGDVVAFDTPRAQDGGYNWARTLWHELGHTFAIGAADFRVPRWFTEGLSVYEEQRARPAWGREMDLQFFAAFDQGKLLPLEEIDRGFTRPTFPGQVLLSYYHAFKVIAYVVAQHGFEAIAGILQQLRAGKTIGEAFEAATGQRLAEVDAGFRASLAQDRDRMRQALAGLPDLLEDEEENAGLLERLKGEAVNPFLQKLQAGHAALREGDFPEAEQRFREALAIYPSYVGTGNAYEGLADIYREQDRRRELEQVLVDYLQIAESEATPARELAALYTDQGEPARAEAYLRRSLDVDPYDRATHTALAEIYTAGRRFSEAIAARRAVLALDPVDRAEAYYRLAQTLHTANRIAEAKRAVLQALEAAPGYRDAQKLLLQCVEASQ